MERYVHIKFRYSEKATKFEKNLQSYLTFTENWEFFLNFVGFSDYLNFTYTFSEFVYFSDNFHEVSIMLLLTTSLIKPEK